MAITQILVVDDELELERLIKQRFRKKIKAQEFDFTFAYNGLEALEILKLDQQIDVILTDIRMPKMNGIDLIGALPNIDDTLKAIVMSSYGDLSNIRMAMNRGAFDFLTKPIDFQDLEATIYKTKEFVCKIRSQKNRLKNAFEKLRYQASHDQLTGLPNQRSMVARIGNFFETVNSEIFPFFILFIHIDNFKSIKYGLGHVFSEELLVEVARRLEICVPSADRIARIGTDEFAILLSNLQDQQEVEVTTNQIHQVLQQPFHLNQLMVSAKAYIGIIDSTIGYCQPIDFLRAADTAMHYAKTDGTVNTATFTTLMQTNATQRIELESDLQIALRNEQLSLNYQPIISIATGQLVGVEALVRWCHPQRGWIPPLEFVRLAEETGLIIFLGRWVLVTACRQLGLWQQQFPQGCPPNISVNLSAVQLWHPDFLHLIDDTLKLSGLHGSHLHLEITESVLMEKGPDAIQLLEQLKERQIQLSIDDFGTGYSSLAYLQSFSIDTLKIDRSFVGGLGQDQKKLDIVQTIVSLAHTLSLNVTAEGIETEEQLAILRSLSCDYGQGYFFSRPLPEAKMVDYLAAVNA